MKRFYTQVSVEPVASGPQGASGWRVMLDGRGIKTASGAAQIVPARALAEAMACEWAGQGEEINTAAFLFRDLADYAIDIIAPDRTAAIRRLLPFAETDTLCYRAEDGEALHERQMDVWEPLLIAAEARWDVHFTRISGIIHRPQPPATLARLQAVLAAQDDFALAALNTLASLAASLVVGLAALAPDTPDTLDTPDTMAETLWNAANLEEDWQAELWGWEADAEKLRARRLATFSAAMQFAALAREG